MSDVLSVEDRIAGLCEALLVSRDPYDAASASKAEKDLCYGIWLTWGALTDLWEEAVDGAGREAAESEMRRAATELIIAVRDETMRKEFFDYWLLERFPSRPV